MVLPVGKLFLVDAGTGYDLLGLDDLFYHVLWPRVSWLEVSGLSHLVDTLFTFSMRRLTVGWRLL